VFFGAGSIPPTALGQGRVSAFAERLRRAALPGRVNGDMRMATVSIGDFSRMTHLSIKTLRHYHDVGLLAPAEIDKGTGYRYYARAQLPTAQVIKRFRDLDMPVDEVRSILGTSDPATRSKLIVAHLDRLERQLKDTQTAVLSLRALVERPETSITVEHRAVPQASAIAITERVALEGFGPWMIAAFTELHAALRTLRAKASGPPGALYATDLFLNAEGEAVLFVPVRESISPVGRAHPFVIPAAELAVTVHHGAHTDMDRTYGALGTHVTEHELGVDGPVREHYLVDRFDTPDVTLWRTEIGWPIFQATER
jgi:DNA-binding transcriptional MerR regulator